MRLENKIKGGIFGLVVGDALGVPYEFKQPKDIPPTNEIEFTPPKGCTPTYSFVKAGTYSDDSAQALCLLDSLLKCKSFDLKDFSDTLLEWRESGLWAVDNHVFDCGTQTDIALGSYFEGKPIEECGLMLPNGKGNGALMRVLPLVLWHKGTNASLISDAHNQCLITHGHITNQVCCALYCLWARYLLQENGIETSYYIACRELKKIYQQKRLSEHFFELDLILNYKNFAGSGYVVDSIASAKYLLFNHIGYEQVVKEAIKLGNDTDTTASIAGGLAGLHYGYKSIPNRWLTNLRDFDKVEEITERLQRSCQNE